MRNTKLAVLLVLVLTLPVFAGGRECQTGKVLDVTKMQGLYEGTSYERDLISVEVGDIVYAGRGRRNAGREFIVGDPVKACIEGNSLYLIRQNGREVKTKIIRRERKGS